MSGLRSKLVTAFTARGPLRAMVLITQLIALRMFAGPWPVMNGFPVDDAWIHQVVARTFATSGTLGYAPGQHGAAATSYVWAALLALNFKFLHLSPVWFTLGINVALTLAAGQLLFLIVEDGARSEAFGPVAPRVVAVLAATIAAIGGNFLWFAFSGMEAMLFATLSLAVIAFIPLSGPPNTRRAALAGVTAAVLAVTRPDAIPLGGALAVLSLLLKRNRKETLLFVAPYALMVVVYLTSNMVLIGTPVPATLKGRRWLWLANATGQSSIDVVWMFIEFWLDRLRAYTLSADSPLVLWAGALVGAHGAMRAIHGRATRVVIVLAWTLFHFSVYAALLPTPGSGGRYQPMVPLAFMLALSLGAIHIGAQLGRLAQYLEWWRDQKTALGIGLAIALVPWAIMVLSGVHEWRRLEVSATSHVRNTEEQLPALINALPKDARVGSFDIGASGFGSDRRIIDVGGLSDTKTAERMSQGRLWEVIRDQKLDYVIIPGTYRMRVPDINNYVQHLALAQNPAILLEPIAWVHTPFYLWIPGAVSTWNNGPRQVLYRVHLTGGTPSKYSSEPQSEGWALDGGGLIDYRTRQQLQYGLGVMARDGVLVDLRIRRIAEMRRASKSDAWVIDVGPWGIQAAPPSSSAASAEHMRAALVELALPYFEAKDPAGASIAVLHGIARSIRAYVDPTFFPKLPMLLEPIQGGVNDEIAAYARWGFGLVALVITLEQLVFRRSRRRRRDAVLGEPNDDVTEAGGA